MSKAPTSSRSSTGQAEHPQALLALCPIPSRDLLLSSGKPQHGMLRGTLNPQTAPGPHRDAAAPQKNMGKEWGLPVSLRPHAFHPAPTHSSETARAKRGFSSRCW